MYGREPAARENMNEKRKYMQKRTKCLLYTCGYYPLYHTPLIWVNKHTKNTVFYLLIVATDGVCVCLCMCMSLPMPAPLLHTSCSLLLLPSNAFCLLLLFFLPCFIFTKSIRRISQQRVCMCVYFRCSDSYVIIKRYITRSTSLYVCDVVMVIVCTNSNIQCTHQPCTLKVSQL